MHLNASASPADVQAQARLPSDNDAVTGLPLLDEFHARLEAHIRIAAELGRSLAVLVLDIDNFTVLHHALGRRQGDALLLAVASSARLSLPADAILGRVSGDTFAAVLPEVALPEDAVAVARRLQQDLVGLQPLAPLAETVHPDLHPGFSVTCSIGISLAPIQGLSADQLLSQAEAALDLARAGGRSGIEVFSAEQAQASSERRMVLLGIPSALQQGELRLRYQPQFAVGTGRLVGVEALLRWRHPRYGLVMPDNFIGAAEACGLIDDIGTWVLREACAQARRWRDQRLPAVPIAVNISTKQLMQPHFLQTVQDALDLHGVMAEQLHLEITESALLLHPQRTLALLRACHDQGLHISLDDFGKGHANLHALLDMPVDEIKIDRSFITGVTGNKRTAAIVSALIQMARDIGLGVVAEGVETPAQLSFLRARGCDKLQGYLFAEPLEPWVYEVQAWGLAQQPRPASEN